MKQTGRPSKQTKAIVQKLVEGLRMDFTVEEACAYAGIAKQTYYNWRDNDAGFLDEMESAKCYLQTVAKKVVAQRMMENPTAEFALRYLEKRQPVRYGKHRPEAKNEFENIVFSDAIVKVIE